MKLAEALSERKSLIGKMNAIQKQGAELFKAGNGKPDSITTLATVENFKSLAFRLAFLIETINHTNNQCEINVFGVKMSLMAAISNKDARNILLDHFENLKREVTDAGYRQEAVVHSLDLSFLNKEIADLKEEIRTIDLKIQEANWVFDLIEIK